MLVEAGQMLAQLNRRFATLTAPTRGVVTNLRLAISQYVAPGTPAMTFIDARGAWITADLRENQLGNVRTGDREALLVGAESSSQSRLLDAGA